jgi:hypothetical protein
MVTVEQLVEWRLGGETKVLAENLPQRHFVHHKSHMTRHGLESGPPWWETSDWQLELWRGLSLRNTLSDENGSVVYNCCWPSPAQPFSGQSPNGTHGHILLSQIRDSSNLEGQVPLFIPPGTGFRFLHLLRLAWLRWRSWNSPTHGVSN